MVGSPFWNNGAINSAGAVTWCDGSTGRVGALSASNSLVGSSASDNIGINGIISYSNFPIRLFTFFGILLSILSIIFIIIQFITHFFIYGRMSTPGISTLIIVTFFFSGVQFLFLGILGEYISAIHSQTRKPKNNVILRKTLNIKDINKIIA
jgi:hypothetical protein